MTERPPGPQPTRGGIGNDSPKSRFINTREKPGAGPAPNYPGNLYVPGSADPAGPRPQELSRSKKKGGR
jgi:hypothetical protein